MQYHGRKFNHRIFNNLHDLKKINLSLNGNLKFKLYRTTFKVLKGKLHDLVKARKLKQKKIALN